MSYVMLSPPNEDGYTRVRKHGHRVSDSEAALSGITDYRYMVVILELPDDIAKALSVPGVDLSRRALEALAIEGFREKKLSQFQVGQLLGLGRIEAEDLIAKHTDLYDYDPAESESVFSAVDKLTSFWRSDRHRPS